jgi:hypothetical protein
MSNSSIATMSDEDNPLNQAKAFLDENPAENATTAARIYKVNAVTLRSYRRRSKAPKRQLGGHNKVLSQVQIDAVYKYVEDSYIAGYGASKQMVFTAIAHLKAAEIPSKKAPSWHWFQTFMKAHPELFRMLKTKAIARVQVMMHDITTVEDWFIWYSEWCTQHDIQSQNVHNFDETGFRVGVAPGEEVIVPAYVQEIFIYTFLLEFKLILYRCMFQCLKIANLLL